MLAEAHPSEKPSTKHRERVCREKAVFGLSLVCLSPASPYPLCCFSALSSHVKPWKGFGAKVGTCCVLLYERGCGSVAQQALWNPARGRRQWGKVESRARAVLWEQPWASVLLASALSRMQWDLVAAAGFHAWCPLTFWWDGGLWRARWHLGALLWLFSRWEPLHLGREKLPLHWLELSVFAQIPSRSASLLP